jgi:hypothetical protein
MMTTMRWMTYKVLGDGGGRRGHPDKRPKRSSLGEERGGAEGGSGERLKKRHWRKKKEREIDGAVKKSK